jgi:hypothetical protein
MWCRGTAPLFLTSALDGNEWPVSRHGPFTPGGKSSRYLLDRRLGGPQGLPTRCGVEINLAPTVQPVARCYTDWAIPTPSAIKVATSWRWAVRFHTPRSPRRSQLDSRLSGPHALAKRVVAFIAWARNFAGKSSTAEWRWHVNVE